MQRRDGETKWVLTPSELWTNELDKGRDFDEPLARQTVTDLQDLAREHGTDVNYWAE